MTEKRYYTLNEALTFLGQLGLTLENFRSQVREKLIHPILYIDSLPAHACEKRADGEAIAVGFCFLSAYWDLGNEIVAIIDTIVREGNVEIRPLIKKTQIIGKPEMFSWQHEPHLFTRVPKGHANPQPFSESLEISYFILINEGKQTVTLTRSNVLISRANFEGLKRYLAEQNIADAIPPSAGTKFGIGYKTPSDLPRKLPKTKQIRTHALNELIKEIYSKSEDKSAAAIWKCLKKLADEGHEILQEVDSWTTTPTASIAWLTHRGKKTSKDRRTFENDIAKLNKAIKEK